MMRPPFALVLVATLFLWAGLIIGISFLEAPLKFTAPHITLALGVGIGRVVFHALNKVEIGLYAGAAVCAIYLRVPGRVGGALVLLAAVLLLQTFWLLPALDVRAEALLHGHPPPASSLHLLYIGVEAVKLCLVLGTGTLAYLALHRPPPRLASPTGF
ncbi:hypothetical protein [Hymenobacter sp. 102]|uniref:hypothetical protein n=1 Tax=Hymenobacter sp. 102 TaxID=3403152 RepID=UPI003CECDE6E